MPSFIGIQPASIKLYATIDDLPLSGIPEGTQALVDSTNKLYIFTDAGWYNIALINQTPSISGVESSYTLESGANTTVTITATDPEGFPLTYSIASDTSGSIATVTQGTGANSNVFTIAASTSSAGAFTLTFRASDGTNVASAASTFTLSLIITNSQYTSTLLTSVGPNGGDNTTFTDSSSNNVTITSSSSYYVTQTTHSPFRSGGYSTFFDGTSDYLEATDASSLNLGSGEFTLETWFRTDSTSNTMRIFNLVNGFTEKLQLYYYYSYGSIVLRVGSSTKTGTTGSGDNYNVIAWEAWNHIALSRDSSNILRLFINGNVVYSATDTTDIDNEKIWIGRPYSTGSYLDGQLRDVRLVIGSAVYTSNFTPPTEPLTAISGTELLTCHANRIYDGSSNNHSIVNYGVATLANHSPYKYDVYNSSTHGGSIYFDTGAATAYLNFDDPGFYGTTGDFTIEAWVMPVSFTSRHGSIYSHGNASSYGSDYFDIRLNTSGQPEFYWGSSTASISGSASAKLIQWNHIAAVRSGSTVTLYLNGESVGSATISGAVPTAGSNRSYIGCRSVTQTSNTLCFYGHISNFRLVVGTAVYTSAFTLPTAQLSNITNTELLLLNADIDIIDKSQSVTRMPMNGVASSTTQTKYLSSSIGFNGTSSYIHLQGNGNVFNFDNRDWTIEGWVYMTDISTTNYILDGRTSATSGITLLYVNSSGVFNAYNGQTLSSAAVSNLENNWVHFALCRNDESLQWYINGTASGSAHSINLNSKWDVADNRFIVGKAGYSSAAYFKGYMSDLRITKGLARYTSNFTPPATALQG
jgi:hypothetical protein